jgi:hypothetical protein
MTMAGSSLEAIELLRSIDRGVRAIEAMLTPLVQQARAAQPKAVASDRELDGQYGNPVVKFNPRDWTGGSCKGRRLSECPPEFLELLAATFDYFAEQAEQKNERTNSGKPVAEYKRADAARARGWAKRMRDGKHTPVPAGAALPANWETEDEQPIVSDGGWAGDDRF